MCIYVRRDSLTLGLIVLASVHFCGSISSSFPCLRCSKGLKQPMKHPQVGKLVFSVDHLKRRLYCVLQGPVIYLQNQVLKSGQGRAPAPLAWCWGDVCAKQVTEICKVMGLHK